MIRGAQKLQYVIIVKFIVQTEKNATTTEAVWYT